MNARGPCKQREVVSKSQSPIRGLYVVLDQASLGKRDPVRTAKRVIDAGARVIQYRWKNTGSRNGGPFYRNALRLAQLCKKRKIPFIVNDRCDIAWAVGADGVHLGTQDLPLDIVRTILGPNAIVGVSSHSQQEALRQSRLLPDYVALGPIYKSRTKQVRKPIGVMALQKVARTIPIPLVAIGGIDKKNAGAVVAAGAHALAVVHAVLGAARPASATRNLVHAMNQPQLRSRR